MTTDQQHADLCAFLDALQAEIPFPESPPLDPSIIVRQLRKVATRFPESSAEYTLCESLLKKRAEQRQQRWREQDRPSVDVDRMTRSRSIYGQDLEPAIDPDFTPRWYPIRNSKLYRMGFEPVDEVPLGEGAVSSAWKVKTIYGGHELVIRRPRTDSEFSAKQLQAILLIELRIAKLFNHPNVAQVYDVGELEGVESEPVPFISMECINGVTLKEWRELHMLTPAQAARVVITIATTLQTLHTTKLKRKQGFPQGAAASYAPTTDGIFHFDLKPSNVMLANRTVRQAALAESTAEAADEHPPVTLLAIELTTILPEQIKLIDLGTPTLSTPGYSAPERSERKATPGAAWDIFSLGGVLFYLVTGSNPKSTAETTQERWAEWLEKIDLHDADLTGICRKALAWEPTQRYQSAQQLAADLAAWLADEPIPHLGRTYSRREKEVMLLRQCWKTGTSTDQLRLFVRTCGVVSVLFVAASLLQAVWTFSGRPVGSIFQDVGNVILPLGCGVALTSWVVARFRVASLRVYLPFTVVMVATWISTFIFVPAVPFALETEAELLKAIQFGWLMIGMAAGIVSFNHRSSWILQIGSWVLMLGSISVSPMSQLPWLRPFIPAMHWMYDAILVAGFGADAFARSKAKPD